jgi:hypothetical protein
MTEEEYYTTPPKKVFNEIKLAALKIWNSYEDDYGYASGKISRIIDLENDSDNAWYMVQMFDARNRGILMSMVSDETKKMIINAFTI